MIVSHRKDLAKRVQRIPRVNDLHIPVADAACDLGIDATGGTRRRRKTCNQGLRAENSQSSHAVHHRHLAVHCLRLEQYGLSPTDLKQFRGTAAACSGVGGHQSCLVSAIEIGMGHQHNPSIQARLCIFSWWLRFWDESRELHQPVRKAWQRVHSTLRFSKCRWRLVRFTMSSVVATLMDLGRIPLEPDIWNHLLATGGFSLAALSPTYLMRSTRALLTWSGQKPARTWTATVWSKALTRVVITNSTHGWSGTICVVKLVS